MVALVVNPLLVWWKIRRNPFPLVLLCLRESGVYAFFTRSSAANIPVNMALCEADPGSRYLFRFYSAGSHHQYGGRSNHYYRVDAGLRLIRRAFCRSADGAAVERGGFSVCLWRIRRGGGLCC